METMTVKIATPSMTPTIAVGEVVTIERRTPEIGDIAAFLVGDSLIIHRVIARWNTAAGEFFVHRGDASKISGLCKAHEVVGTVADFDRREPSGLDALTLAFKGRLVGVGAILSRASELRPFYLALIKTDADTSNIPVIHAQAPIQSFDEEAEPEYELPETPLPSDLLAMPDAQWAEYRLSLLQNASAEMEAAEAKRLAETRGGVVFPNRSDDWETTSKSAGYSSFAKPCATEDKR